MATTAAINYFKLRKETSQKCLFSFSRVYAFGASVCLCALEYAHNQCLYS